MDDIENRIDKTVVEKQRWYIGIVKKHADKRKEPAAPKYVVKESESPESIGVDEVDR